MIRSSDKILFFVLKPLDFIIQILLHIFFFFFFFLISSFKALIFLEFDYQTFEYFKNFEFLFAKILWFCLFHYFKRLF